MAKAPQRLRADYNHITGIETRWMDNDVYGHVNNVVYYSYFDTIVNRYLIAAGVLEIGESPVIGLVVETACRYFSPTAFPETLDGALRVAHIGDSSVRYEIGIFRTGENTPVAEGHFVHVYVDRQSRRPTSLPAPWRAALEKIAV